MYADNRNLFLQSDQSFYCFLSKYWRLYPLPLPGQLFSKWQIDNILLLFPGKQAMTFHANCLLRRQFACNVIAYFLGKIKTTYMYFKLSSAENFTQNAKPQSDCAVVLADLSFGCLQYVFMLVLLTPADMYWFAVHLLSLRVLITTTMDETLKHFFFFYLTFHVNYLPSGWFTWDVMAYILWKITKWVVEYGLLQNC